MPSWVEAVGAREATRVPRQKRSALEAPVTLIWVTQQFTLNDVPVSAFSGRPPSAGGLNRGSRQVPVHVGGSCGSILALAWVSL